MNLLLFGPPGAGKGTQADLISKKFNLKQISTGNILREEVSKNTLLGKEIESIISKGNLVSNDIVNKLVENILSNSFYNEKIIFDGYPRNINQAKDLEKLLIKYKQKISAIIYLYVSKKSIETRIENRIFCKKCQKTFNQLHNPSNLASHTCGTKYLTKRSDDNIDIILRRYDNYQKLANPLLEHYKKFPFFHEIDGSRKIDEISNEINTILSNIMN